MKLRAIQQFFFHSLLAGFLLLSLASAGMWARSWRIAEQVSFFTDDSDFRIHSVAGRISLHQSTGWSLPSKWGPWKPGRLTWVRRPISVGLDETLDPDNTEAGIGTRAERRRLWGFEFTSGVYSGSYSAGLPEGSQWYRLVVVPYWAPALVFGAPPVLVWGRRLHRRLRAARRRRRGLCPACGYDLRGGQTRCPECGAAAAAPLRAEHPAVDPPAAAAP